jgi:hypothetical protein
MPFAFPYIKLDDTIQKIHVDGTATRVKDAKKKFWRALIDLAAEAKTLSCLEHPHIIKLRAVASLDPTDPTFFLILDRMYGTLAERIKCWAIRRQRLKSVVSRVWPSKKDINNDSASGGIVTKKDCIIQRLQCMYDVARAVEFLVRALLCYMISEASN